MIVSHERRFVFFRTRKTAGTSVETALAPFCGRSDYITRAAARTAAEMGNGAIEHRSRVPLRAWRAWTVKEMVKSRRVPVVWNHMEAAQIRPMLTAEQWSGYLKFTVVRNPYDAAISFYYWKLRDVPEERRPPLREFVRDGGMRELTWNWRTFTIDDRVVVDHVCRYENLAADLADVADRIGLPSAPVLPLQKSGTRADRRAPRDVLDEESAAAIGRLFRRELDAFGYTL